MTGQSSIRQRINHFFIFFQRQRPRKPVTLRFLTACAFQQLHLLLCFHSLTDHPVPQPFLVIATQNPAGASGTQLLPDSQLDRFLLRLSIGYPSPADELELLRRRQYGQAMDPVRRVLGREELEHLRGMVDRVHISDEILQYIVRLVNATRSHPQLAQGASPRATLAVTAASRAVAFLRGRDYVVPEDVQTIWRDVIAHRLILAPGVEGTVTGQAVAAAVLKAVEPPRIR